MNDDLKLTVGKALGRLPSGAFVLTVGQGDAAMLVSWVQQAGFEPPALTVALAKDRPVGQLLREKRTFALSLLAADDKALLKKYARGIPAGEDAFADVNTLKTPSNTIVLADSLAYLDCELLTVHDLAGDHELFLARIVGGKILKDSAPFIHLRGSGFHY